MQDETAEKLADITKRSEKQRRWFHARQPQAIGKVMGQLVIQNRYACNEANDQLDQIWATAVGNEKIAARCQATGLKRGKLEVTVAHSAIAQELSMDSARILQRLRAELPETTLLGVKYRVGVIEKT